jgi:hypothetical protein
VLPLHVRDAPAHCPVVLIMTYEQAEELARAWLRIQVGEHVALQLDATIDKPYGWVFFYNSREWLATKDSKWALGGNAPIIVGIDGEIRVTGTAHPVEHYLSEYEATLPPARLRWTSAERPAT